MATRSSRALWLTALGVACGPVAGSPPSPAPMNACTFDGDCAGYKPAAGTSLKAACVKGACTVATQIDYTLVVSVPETSFFAPNTTFAIPFVHLFDHADSQCTNIPIPPQTLPCAKLPEAGFQTGLYDILRSAEIDVGYYLGNSSDGNGVHTTLPATVTYRPLWPADLATASDPMVQGLPLLPVSATRVYSPFGAPGPLAGPIAAFQVQLAPGVYERTVMPDPPYDTAFPPDVAIVQVASGPASQTVPSLVNVDSTPNPQGRAAPNYDIRRDVDGKSLDGATAFLRDQKTHRRVSSFETFGAANRSGPPFVYHVQLNTNHHPPDRDAITGTELVVVPNVDGAPTLVIPPIGELPVKEIYPQIPPPVSVSGTVTSTGDNTAIAATILLASTKIYATNAAGFSPNLSYETSFQAGADGRYSVLLPPGEYDVVAIPLADALAKTVAPSLKIDTTSFPQAGKNIQVSRKKAVHGTVVVTDGRLLAGAEVEARAAAAGQSDNSAPAHWPRSATTTTDDSGRFSLALDPGTYDVTVRPALGTRLPWIVSPSQVVAATGVPQNPLALEVPAPIAAFGSGSTSLMLMDPRHNPIPRAVVRAYAAPKPGAPMIEIGRALTDNDGAFVIYLAGVPR